MSPQPNEPKEKRNRPVTPPTGTTEAAAASVQPSEDEEIPRSDESSTDDPLTTAMREQPEMGSYTPPRHIFDLLGDVLHGKVTMPDAKREWREKWLPSLTPEQRKDFLEHRHESARRMMQAAESLSQDLISYL